MIAEKYHYSVRVCVCVSCVCVLKVQFTPKSNPHIFPVTFSSSWSSRLFCYKLPSSRGTTQDAPGLKPAVNCGNCCDTGVTVHNEAGFTSWT